MDYRRIEEVVKKAMENEDFRRRLLVGGSDSLREIITDLSEEERNCLLSLGEEDYQNLIKGKETNTENMKISRCLDVHVLCTCGKGWVAQK